MRFITQQEVGAGKAEARQRWDRARASAKERGGVGFFAKNLTPTVAGLAGSVFVSSWSSMASREANSDEPSLYHNAESVHVSAHLRAATATGERRDAGGVGDGTRLQHRIGR